MQPASTSDLSRPHLRRPEKRRQRRRSSLDEGRHVLGAKINSPEVLEEFFLAEPEDTIVGLGWLANILHLRVVRPSRSIVTPLTRSKLAFAPRVSYFDEIVLRSRDIVEAGDDCVSMPVYNAIGGVGVRSCFGSSGHDIVLIIPSTHALEHLIEATLGSFVTTTAHLGPIHWPQSLGSLVSRILQRIPLLAVWVELSQALELIVTSVHEGVLIFTPGQQSPCMGTLTTIDLIPSSAMDGHRFLHIASPEFTIIAGMTSQEITAIGFHA
mmetsp:Transcript_3959/g.6522  ORF Transcript_3959/g.6522 Transcript_3959/m.6522 type:complete len:268 (-) Transcript_3959:844-1647(-)